MSMQATIDSLPRILISKAEEMRLTRIATAASQRVPEVAAALLSELERADVLPETAMPADVVRIGSIIEFEVDDGRRLKVQLVLPENADINVARISVLTPVGAALIGLSPGQAMEWSGNDGKERLLTVLTVSRPDPTDCKVRPTEGLLATKRDGSGNLFAQASI